MADKHNGLVWIFFESPILIQVIIDVAAFIYIPTTHQICGLSRIFAILSLKTFSVCVYIAPLRYYVFLHV